jgi:hypothetical protein
MATSAVSALIDKYNSISATYFGGTDRPPIALDSEPVTGATGAQRRVPYVVLKDQGFRPEFNSSTGGIENGTLIVEVYAELLGGSGVTVDSIVQAIKYAGQDPEDKAGFDWGSLTLTGFNYGISLKRTKERRSYAGFNFNGNRVHKCEITYECTLGLKPRT